MWTPQEIAAYRPRAHVLGIYSERGLSDASPEQRAEFLVNYLGLTMTDHDVVMRLAAKDGRHVALNLIEDMLISRAL